MSMMTIGDTGLAEGAAALVVGVAALGVVAAVGTAVAAGAVLKEAVTLGIEAGQGTVEVLGQILEENREMYNMEHEYIIRLREERKQQLDRINFCISDLKRFYEADEAIMSVSEVPGGKEAVASFMNKREQCISQIRELRDKAARSDSSETILKLADMVEKIHSGFETGLQNEMKFFAKNGLVLPEFGSVNDDAIRLAVARKNEVGEVSLRILDINSQITEAMIRSDLDIFEDDLAELLCIDELNSRQLRDIFAVKQDILKLRDCSSLTCEIKKKRIASLFEIYTKRKRGILAEHEEMSEYYEEYLKETYDIPESRTELADFDSADEIILAVRKAKSDRTERIKKQYIQMQIDRVMKKNGLNVVESAVIGRKENDQRILYSIDDKSAVDVFISDENLISTRVVGIDFGGKASDTENDRLVEKGHKFCSKMTAIEDDLAEVGIIIRRKKTVPPDRIHSTWIQLDKNNKNNKGKSSKRKRTNSDNKVMYME